jgi:hypothetical protein
MFIPKYIQNIILSYLELCSEYGCDLKITMKELTNVNNRCFTCDRLFCNDCLKNCNGCDDKFCLECSRIMECCEEYYCNDCDEEWYMCDGCDCIYCYDCKNKNGWANVFINGGETLYATQCECAIIE